MIYILIYFLIIFLYFWPYRKENTIRRFILGLYLFSAAVSVIKAFVNPGDYPINPIAILYFTICILILLMPFKKFGNLNCNSFTFPSKYLSIVSSILISFGLISYIYTIPRLLTLQTLVVNLSDIRKTYYSGETIFDTATSIWELIANWVSYIQFLSPFLCFYYFIKGKSYKAILLALVAFTPALNKIIIGEREASVIVISNFIFSYIFWNPKFSRKQIDILKKFCIILSFPFILFVALMTISRFSEDGIGNSLMTYIGEQPFNFSYFFSHINIEEQTLGGKLNFGYLFPEKEQLVGQLNDFISSKEYLNVFGGIPGSFLFDFGYWEILIIILLSCLFYVLINNVRIKHNFFNLLSYIIYFQIMFMGIFYYDFTARYSIYMCAIFYATYGLWSSLNSCKHKIKYNNSIINN